MFTGVTDAMRILQEEISEPMVTVTSLDTYEETIALVNESEYSTTCGIMNGDMTNELQASRQIDAGITLNNYYRNALGTPFTGAKHNWYGRQHCNRNTSYSWAKPPTYLMELVPFRCCRFWMSYCRSGASRMRRTFGAEFLQPRWSSSSTDWQQWKT